MKENLVDDVYATLIGVAGEAYQVPGVENAFAPGEYCDRRYADMTAHRQRLWERLGSEDDEDIDSKRNWFSNGRVGMFYDCAIEIYGYNHILGNCVFSFL